MWELDHKDGWVLKNWCFQTVLLEKTLKSPLDSKVIKPINPKGNQPWIFIGRTDAEALILWPCDLKTWLIGKDPNAGKGWRREEKGMTEDEVVGWHHWLWDMSLGKLQQLVMNREYWLNTLLQSMESQRVRRDQATELTWKGPVVRGAPNSVTLYTIDTYLLCFVSLRGFRILAGVLLWLKMRTWMNDGP